jgi:hypothetical protein
MFSFHCESGFSILFKMDPLHFISRLVDVNEIMSLFGHKGSSFPPLYHFKTFQHNIAELTFYTHWLKERK